MAALEPAARACLERTRTAVANILVAAGIGIALSGLVLGPRDRGALGRSSEWARRGALLGLLTLVVSSFAVRRIGARRAALRDPARRAARFGRAHVRAAALAALAVPLGFAFGWAVDPRLEAVVPFWVAALAMGSLAVPRAHDLEGFDSPMLESSEPNA
jgi:hypothetical protein